MEALGHRHALALRAASFLGSHSVRAVPRVAPHAGPRSTTCLVPIPSTRQVVSLTGVYAA